jgi:hypothetical protein
MEKVLHCFDTRIFHYSIYNAAADLRFDNSRDILYLNALHKYNSLVGYFQILEYFINILANCDFVVIDKIIWYYSSSEIASSNFAKNIKALEEKVLIFQSSADPFLYIMDVSKEIQTNGEEKEKFIHTRFKEVNNLRKTRNKLVHNFNLNLFQGILEVQTVLKGATDIAYDLLHLLTSYVLVSDNNGNGKLVDYVKNTIIEENRLKECLHRQVHLCRLERALRLRSLTTKVQ